MLISTPEAIHQLVKDLVKVDRFAFDTEFIRESTFYPQLEILQIGAHVGPKGEIQTWLIDVPAFLKLDEEGKKKPGTSLAPLIDLFVDPKILKIVHAAHGDQECLWAAFGALASPVFDTAIGASLVWLGDNIGLGNLLKQVLGIEIPKGYARTNWAKRPLPKPVLEYAALDVKHLIEASDVLFGKLDKENRREWALELSSKFSDVTLYEPPPEDIAKRLAQSGKFNVKDFLVLLELVRWRETRVRELNVPRRWLADDGVLIDLAKIKPRDIEELQGFRGLSKGEARGSQGGRILNAIRKGVDSKDAIPVDIKERAIRQPSGDESRAMELLRVCLQLMSEEFGIASKHIVQPNHVLPLLRLRPESPKQLRESGFISGQIGDEGLLKIYAFLKGEAGLRLDRGKVKLV
ncbi:MAG: HRDC domain-containing protein [Bdellovibrionales bacterium]|nr:HRDC domain-containing protein [Bdellovibrionales bacterium]